MKHIRMIWIVLFGLLASSALIQQLTFARPMPQATTANQYAVYLPLVTGGSTAPQQPVLPTPIPLAPSGFFASTSFLSYNAATATDAQGGMHLAFYASDERQQQPLGQPAFYTSCTAGTAACADPKNWSDLVQIDTAVNEVQIVVTNTGKPRLLIRRNSNNGYDYDYWACEQQCSNGQNWSGLFVTQAAGVEVQSADLPQHSFALDAQGRPRFIWSNGWGNQRTHGLYYAICDAADCTEIGSWQQTLLETLTDKTVTADYASLVFAGEKPRFVTRINHSGLPVYTKYFECDQDCTNTNNWWSTIIDHPQGKMWFNWDLALDAQGHPRIALYESPGIDITVSGKLFYAWCDNNCVGHGPAFQIVQVASGEGQGVDLAIDPQGRTHMVYDAGQRGTLGELWCDTHCTDANAWQRRILETSEQLTQQFAPASPLTCSQQDRAWFDSIPQVAFDANGQMIVAYDAKNVARCFSIDPADPTKRIYSRIERIWWAVRLVQFPRA